MKKAVDNKTQEVIGSTSVLLEGVNEYCRFRECNLGSFIMDSFVDYVSNKKYLNKKSKNNNKKLKWVMHTECSKKY